jgi:hypothetical protein
MVQKKYEAYAKEFYVLIKLPFNDFSLEEKEEYIKLLSRYSFKGRSRADNPHPNTKRDYSNRKKSNSETPIGLARATLRLMDLFYNARTANNLRKSLVELLEKEI